MDIFCRIQSTKFYTVIGNRFSVPADISGKTVSKVYDSSGKLIYSGVANNGFIDISGNNKKINCVLFLSFSPKR